MLDDIDPAIQNIITNFTDVFELQVLGCCIQIPKFYYTYREHIGKFDSGYEECNEFTAEVDNELYIAIAKYYDALASADASDKISACPWAWVEAILQGKIDKSQIGSDTMVNGHLRFGAATRQNARDFRKTVEKGIPFWLVQKRMRRGVSPLLQDFNKDVDDVKSVISVVESSIQGLGNRETVGLSAGILNDDSLADDIIPFPLPTMNNAMEGGATKQETVLGVAPQNGGKTVMATLCTRYWADLQHKVLFISTEEPVTRITPRVVSSGLKMNYSLMARGLKKRNFEEQTWTDITNYVARLDKNIRFRFHKDAGKGIADLLPSIIEMEKESGFIPDIVVLDWLGGGLGEKDRNDSNTMTQFYKESAGKLKTVAIDYDIMLMTMAQAGMMKSKDQKLIDASMIDNCTGLGERFDFGYGISCLAESSVDKSIRQGTWKQAQYLNMFKIRYSVGGVVPVLREFHQQRFADVLAQAPAGGETQQDQPVRRHDT